MKANELRVGNLVERDGNILEVIRVAKDGIVNYDLVRKSQGMHVNSGNVIPIPLTEEWLSKFGFEKNENGFFDLIKDSEVEILIRDDYWTCDGIVFSLFNLKYVHQLQNLFFVLTGEELKIIL